MRNAIAIALLAVSAAAVAEGQETADKYLVLAAQRTGTMQQEINDAAAKGFRVVAASRTEGTEVIVLLEQSTDKYQYRLVATTKTGTLQREIGEAADAGYRVVPRAVTTKRTSGGFSAALAGNSNNEGELLVLMEKGPEGPAKAQYQVLATARTGTLQKEISQAAINGYFLVALASRGEHVAILERGSR